MRQWYFITLFARPTTSRPAHWAAPGPGVLDNSGKRNDVHFSSPSALPQASQGKEDASGQQAFNNACRTCHMVREGDNRLGPNLHKVVGRKAGSLPDYGFSSAMKETASSGMRRNLIASLQTPMRSYPATA